MATRTRPQRKLKPEKRIIRSAADKEAFRELVYETVKDSPIPLALTELVPMLAESTGVYGISVYAHTVAGLVNEGRLFKRTESTEEHRRRHQLLNLGAHAGRPYMLFWASADIPERRTLPDVVPVRRWAPGESDDIRFRTSRNAVVATAVQAEAAASVALDHDEQAQTIAVDSPDYDLTPYGASLLEEAESTFARTDEADDGPFKDAIAALQAQRVEAKEEQIRAAANVARIEAAIAALRAL